MGIIEKAANKIADYKIERESTDEVTKAKIQYGIQIIIINLSKLVVIYSLAVYLHDVWPVTIMLAAMGVMRMRSFGMHSKSGIACTLSSIFFFHGGYFIAHFAYLWSSHLGELEWFALLGLTGIVHCWGFWRYAPADTENRPLYSSKQRKRLKKQTLMHLCFLYVIIILSGNSLLSYYLIIPITVQLGAILPVTYKLLNRRYNNYEEQSREILT